MRATLRVYNEACGLSVMPFEALSDALELGDEKPEALEQAFRLVRLELVQDDPFGARVVAGEPLNAEEEALWLRRHTARLKVSDDGGVLVSGGFDVDVLDDWEGDDFCKRAAVPAGDYRLDIYTYSTSVNAMDIDTDAWGDQIDALNEQDFENSGDDDADEYRYVDFVFHFTPWEDGVAISPAGEDGWMDPFRGETRKLDPWPGPLPL